MHENPPAAPDDSNPENNDTPESRQSQTTRRMKISGEVVAKATKDLPADQREAVLWLHNYAWTKNIGLKEAATLISYDQSTLSRVFNGTYAGNMISVTEAIQKFRKVTEERSTIRRVPFIQTSIATRVEKACELALIYQKMVLLIGDSQIGKTASLEEYARNHNHGQTIYVRMSTGGVLWTLLAELADRLSLPTTICERDLRRKIISCFDDTKLLIIDEAHAGFSGRGSTMAPMRSIEFIREIHDRAKCGVVLCGTNTLSEEIQRGAWSKMLEQVQRRTVATVKLPATPKAEDLKLVASSLGLSAITPEAKEIQTDIIKTHGLGKWITLLITSTRVAANKQQAFGWGHVVEAHATLHRLENGK